jgi:hypothetical protein
MPTVVVVIVMILDHLLLLVHLKKHTSGEFFIPVYVDLYVYAICGSYAAASAAAHCETYCDA